MTLSSSADSTLINSYIASQTAATTAATTTSSTSSSQSTLIGNYDTFLKILTAQLKNQDPTSPMDASEFTQQLVQYSTVEQQIATNDKLEDIFSAINSNGITPLLGYVGQYVEAKADGTLQVQGGSAKLAYTLPSEASSVMIYVKDSAGKVISEIDGTTAKGLNRVAWDGTLDSGEKAADGAYSFTIAAKTSDGEAMTLDDVRVIGLVTGVETQTDGTVTLKAGDLSIADTDILSVFASVQTTTDEESGASG